MRMALKKNYSFAFSITIISLLFHRTKVTNGERSFEASKNAPHHSSRVSTCDADSGLVISPGSLLFGTIQKKRGEKKRASRRPNSRAPSSGARRRDSRVGGHAPHP